MLQNLMRQTLVIMKPLLRSSGILYGSVHVKMIIQLQKKKGLNYSKNSINYLSIFLFRSRLIEIFYILLKNNAVILKWFFKSLEESIVESRTEGTQGYVAGFDLIESLTSQYAKTDENEFFFGSEHLLNLFQKLIVDLNGSDENSEYLSCLFDSLSQFFQNLKLKEQNEPNLVQIQFKIIENLLDLVLSEQFDNIFKQNWPNYSALIIKCSLVFKSFSSS